MMAHGWAFPLGHRKAHYFVDTRSLCRKWGFYSGPLQADDGTPSKDDCAECRRRFEKRLLEKEARPDGR